MISQSLSERAQRVGIDIALHAYTLFSDPANRGSTWTPESMPGIVDSMVRTQVEVGFTDDQIARFRADIVQHALGGAQRVINAFQMWDRT
jgi:hypothetical protein